MEGNKEVGHEECDKTELDVTENKTRQNQGETETDNQHTIHLITEEKLKTIHNNLKTKPTFCLIHKETEICLFCRSCERLVCTSCFIDGDHANHTFCKIDDAIKTKEQELKDQIAGAKDNMTKCLQQNIRILTKQRQNVSENCKTVSAEIDSRKNDMLQEVEAWSINLHSMVREYKRKRLQNFDDLLSESEMCLAHLEILQRNYHETIDGKKLIQILELLQNNTGAQAEEESEDSEGNEKIIFTTGEGDADQMDVWFGKVTGIIHVDNPHKELKFKFCNSQIDHISPLDAKRAFVVTEGQLYLVDLTKAKYKQDDLVPLMTDVVYITPVTKRGIYVQQEKNTIVQRITAAGQVYHFADLKPHTAKEIWQTMRITDTGIVVSVTETGPIQTGPLETGPIKTVPILIQSKRTFQEPLGYKKRMIMYNNCGMKQTEIWNAMYETNHFLCRKPFPECVITESDLYILITSKDQPGKIMNLKDTSFTYNGCIGAAPEKMFYPRGLCKDQSDYLIVSDYWNHAIHQLTPRGKFRKFLMREEDGLTHPTVVGIDNNKWMWVAQEDGNIHVIKYIS